MKKQDDYLGKLSCMLCKKLISVRAFHTHDQRMHLKTQTGHLNQLHHAQPNAVKASTLIRSQNIEKYNTNPKHCPHCQLCIPYDNRRNSFCSSSCAASFNGPRRDYTTFTTGPKKGTVATNRASTTRITQCKICLNFYPSRMWCNRCCAYDAVTMSHKLIAIPTPPVCRVCGVGLSCIKRTCSTKCQSELHSRLMKEKIRNGFNPQKHRGRDKISYLESSFAQWLTVHNIAHEVEVPFQRISEYGEYEKTYFADFYFPALSLIIELDGSQHQQTTEYDRDRDNYIQRKYSVNIIRITHKEYQKHSRVQEIKQLLGIV